MDWLCSLPAQFPKYSKFVAYGISYDVTQLLKDLPFEIAWEVQHKKPFAERSYPPDRQRPPSLNHVAIWETKRPDGTPVVFGTNYLKGKWIKIGRMADPDKLFKRSKKREFDYEGYIKIFEVWGYFQSSFQSALKGMEKNIEMSSADWDMINWGKSLRGDFSNQPFEKIKAYTETELRLTCRMMTAVREELFKLGSKITRWHGPGPVAKHFLNK